MTEETKETKVEEEEEKKEEIDPALVPLEPADTKGPTKFDLKATEELQKYLQSIGTIADQANMDHRFKVFEALSNCVNEFIEKVRVKKKIIPAEGEPKPVGKLFYSGSFKLGVCFPDSDIDTVCLAPEFVQIDDFFNVLYPILNSKPECSNIIQVKEASVPIMKLTYLDVDIDMSFVQLTLETIPDDINLFPDSIIGCIKSRKAVISINSLRVNNMVLKLVPNLESFKVLLRFVRCWANHRALYGNVYGYFGGINLTILSAYVCEKYPNASPAMLILRFFNEVVKWNWPSPLYINTPNTGALPSWDRTNSPFDIMPIITPAYPTTNSLKSATHSSSTRIIDEMKKCIQIMPMILQGKESWSALCQDSDFFSTFKKYIEIKVSADEKEDFNWWSGAVVSKIKGLIIALERVPYIQSAPVYPHNFQRQEGVTYIGTLYIAIICDPEKPKEEKIELTAPVEKFLKDAYSIEDRPRTSKIDLKIIKKSKLPDFVFPGGERPKKKRNKKKSKKAKSHEK